MEHSVTLEFSKKKKKKIEPHSRAFPEDISEGHSPTLVPPIFDNLDIFVR